MQKNMPLDSVSQEIRNYNVANKFDEYWPTFKILLLSDLAIYLQQNSH